MMKLRWLSDWLHCAEKDPYAGHMLLFFMRAREPSCLRASRVSLRFYADAFREAMLWPGCAVGDSYVSQ